MINAAGRVLGALTCSIALLALPAAGTAEAPGRSGGPSTAQRVQQLWSPGLGDGRGPVRLSGLPIREQEIAAILPQGTLQGDDVFPSEFLYVLPGSADTLGSAAATATTTAAASYDVVAVASGQVTRVEAAGGNGTAYSYALVIEHASGTWSYVTGLTGLGPDLVRQLGTGGAAFSGVVPVRLGVNAGQVLGSTSQRGVGFALVDTGTRHAGFVRPERLLEDRPWRLHTVDPFARLEPRLEKRLLERVRRQAKPRVGEFAYDVDGRLAGNWYAEAALEGAPEPSGAGRLCFAYHPVDPSQVVVSFNGLGYGTSRYQVRGNSPSPREVRQESGIARYDLLTPRIDLRTGEVLSAAEGRPVGVLLAQLVEKRRVRVQLFLGKGPEEIRGFTEGATLFVR